MNLLVRRFDHWGGQPVAGLRLRLRDRLLDPQEVTPYRGHLVTVLNDVVVKGTVSLLAAPTHVFIILVGAVVVVALNGGRRSGLRVLWPYLILALLNIVAHGSAELTVIQTAVTTYLNLDIDQNNSSSRRPPQSSILSFFPYTQISITDYRAFRHTLSFPE